MVARVSLRSSLVSEYQWWAQSEVGLASRRAAITAMQGTKIPKAPSLVLPFKNAISANDVLRAISPPTIQCGASLLGSLWIGAVANKQRTPKAKPIRVASIELRPCSVQ